MLQVAESSLFAHRLVISHSSTAFSTSGTRFQRKNLLSRKHKGKFIVCKASAKDSVSVRVNGNPSQKSSPAVQSGTETAVVGTNSISTLPPPTYISSPLLWIGVGVGISAVFTWTARRVQRYAMQQIFKTIMGPSNVSTNLGGGMPMPLSGHSPFPTFKPPTESSPSVSKVDVSTSERIDHEINSDGVEEVKEEPKKAAFVDVSPEEVLNQKTYVESLEDSKVKNTPQVREDSNPENYARSESSQSDGTRLSSVTLNALEKMMEDPAVQEMMYPYFPAEVQNPAIFKEIMQDPECRKQIEDTINTMTGNGAGDPQITELWKNFDRNSEQIKQQFAQNGLTFEEVVSKILKNPDVAMAFQNPKVQAAIMDCSQNPMSITKYQNDKEVMDAMDKISQLFLGKAP